MPVPRLSIIIPYLGSEQRLEDTLVSVLTHRPAKTEIMVVHDGSYPDRYDIGPEVDLLVDTHTFEDTVDIHFGTVLAALEYENLGRKNRGIGYEDAKKN